MIKYRVIMWDGTIITVDNLDVAMEFLDSKQARMVERVQEW